MQNGRLLRRRLCDNLGHESGLLWLEVVASTAPLRSSSACVIRFWAWVSAIDVRHSSDTLASHARSAASSWDCACSNSVFAFSTNRWDISYSIGPVWLASRSPGDRHIGRRFSNSSRSYTIAEIHCASQEGRGRGIEIIGLSCCIILFQNLGQKDPHDRQRPLRRLAQDAGLAVRWSEAPAGFGGCRLGLEQRQARRGGEDR
jgi:hypothetical protein